MSCMTFDATEQTLNTVIPQLLTILSPSKAATEISYRPCSFGEILASLVKTPDLSSRAHRCPR